MVQAIKDCAIYMMDPDGHVISWNHGAERIKGYSASEVIGDLSPGAPWTEWRHWLRDRYGS